MTEPANVVIPQADRAFVAEHLTGFQRSDRELHQAGVVLSHLSPTAETVRVSIPVAAANRAAESLRAIDRWPRERYARCAAYFEEAK